MVGIDQGLTCINQTVNKVGFEKYTEKVKKHLEDLLRSPNQEIPQLKNIRDLIQIFTGRRGEERGWEIFVC